MLQELSVTRTGHCQEKVCLLSLYCDTSIFEVCFISVLATSSWLSDAFGRFFRFHVNVSPPSRWMLEKNGCDQVHTFARLGTVSELGCDASWSVEHCVTILCAAVHVC